MASAQAGILKPQSLAAGVQGACPFGLYVLAVSFLLWLWDFSFDTWEIPSLYYFFPPHFILKWNMELKF